jgi:hypothetical protein
MINPLIYSVRNQDVKVALRKNLSERKFWLENNVSILISDDSLSLINSFLVAYFVSYIFPIMYIEI